MDSDSTLVPEYLKTLTVRLCQNLVRVDSLVDLHSFLSGILEQYGELPEDYRNTPHDRLPDVQDILRAATVLLHASLEDFLRTVASAHLPRRVTELMEHIPLAGTGNSRQTKYTLSDLLVLSGKSVDTIIDESIDQWLNQQSFNNCADVAAILRHIGIDPATCNAEFTSLEKMISRRHRIVHNADRSNDTSNTAAGALLPLSAGEVQEWRKAVQRFMTTALYQLQFIVEDKTTPT